MAEREESITDAFGGRCYELPKINIDLMQEIADWIQAPVLKGDLAWNQGNWIAAFFDGSIISSIARETGAASTQIEEDWCGTACCVAGYATVQQLGTTNTRLLNTVLMPHNVTRPDGTVVEVKSVEAAGKAILGLTYTEGDRLFAASNTKDVVLGHLQTIAQSRGYSLEI